MPKTSKKHDKNIENDQMGPSATSHMSSGFFKRLSFSLLALFFLLYVAFPSFILSVFLLLRVGTPQVAYWASMAVLGGILFHFRNKLGFGDYLVFFSILLLCYIYAYFSIDLSTDGLAYHQPAIRRIASGFNPIYDGYMNLGHLPDVRSDQATYFPKALWYFSAAASAAFGDIQIGKVYNPLLILAALFFVLDAVKKEHVSQRALWAIACLNPIAFTQMPYDLADGALSSLVTISLCYAYLFFTDKPISRFQHFFCVVALAMIFCVKTSGFGYGCVVIFFIALHCLIERYREYPEQSAFKRFPVACKTAIQQSLRLGIPVFLLVLVWGFAPYATNLLNGRNIFLSSHL